MGKKQSRRNAGKLYDLNTLLAKTRLRVDEAAAVLDIHESTVRRWADENKIVSVPTAGGHRRIKTESLMKFL